MDFQGAMEDYEDALALEPDFADAWYARGLILEEQEDYGAALASYDNALRHAPNHADTLCVRGALFRKLGETDFALSDLDKCLQCDPAMTEAWVEKAKLLRYQFDSPVQALTCLSRAIELEPEPEYFQMRSAIYMQLNERERAFEDFNRYISALNALEQEVSSQADET